MKFFLSIALRNLLRNKKRSLITLTAITFGLGALIFLRGFIYGAQQQMIENVSTTLTSDAQIVPKALENIYNANGAIENPEAIRKILHQDPRIAAFSERIIGAGMVSSDKGVTPRESMMTYLVGFDPDQETALGSQRGLVQGRTLTAEDQEGVALGEKMRKILKINIGDKITVIAQDYYGSLAGGSYQLLGTFETGNDQIDNGTVMMLLPSAQKLLSLEQRISKFALRIQKPFKIEEVVADLREKVSAEGLSILTWEELIPMIAQMIRFQNGMILVVVLIVLTVVAAGILNTLMMSIIERTREFGLVMSLGTKPSQVMLMIALESFLMTAFGSLLGIGLGAAATLYAGHTGINLSRFVQALSNLLIGSHVYPRIDWAYLFLFVGVVMVSNILVSLYPAWRASRLEPIEAMRQAG
ncbi:MAG: ABC transporter permease [Deltaproteobacteria bacterium]|nr:ABC transporter permease [Deltaproteobacteria bacterium]